MKIAGVGINWRFVIGVVIATLIANFAMRLFKRSGADEVLDKTVGPD